MCIRDSLGADIREDGGRLCCTAPRLVGRELILSLPSVGATENLMLAACGGEGTTSISNAAREPEKMCIRDRHWAVQGTQERLPRG